MNAPFLIYIKAIGIYALLTIPALSIPIIYVISLLYVLFYGWFAWAVFTLIYLVTIFCNPGYFTKMFILPIGVLVAVLFAFQMLEILGVEDNIWGSGIFLLFPAAAVFSGWLSLGRTAKTIKVSNREQLLNYNANQINNENNLV